MDKQVEEILSWSSDAYLLEEALDGTSEGLLREYSGSILRMLNEMDTSGAVVPVSAKQVTGVETLYGELQRTFLGGDNIII